MGHLYCILVKVYLNVALKRQLGMLPNLYQAGLLDVL
jgi:hypothetical protein